jgi:hypothetical protein
VFDGVLRALAVQGTVMVVEDAHWADEATLDVLRFLAGRIAELPALLVVTYRDDELGSDHPLRRVLGALAGPAVTRLPLARLSATAVRQLAAGSGADAREVHRVTGGNPFFVTELLAVTEVDVPATVRDAVVARLGMLSPPTQRAMELLATMPGAVSRPLAERLLGDTAELAEAERRGVLEADAEHVWFRHELARRAIEQQLPATARVDAHRRVLAALLAHPGAELSRLSHHAYEAGDPKQIIEYGLGAAREAAAAGAFHQALDHYEAVLRRSGLLPDEQRAVVLEESVWVLYNCYRFTAAVDRAREVVALRRAIGDPATLGGALTTLSRALYMVNDPIGSGAAVDRAVELLEPLSDDARLARAYSYRAAIRKLTDRPEAAIESARRALAGTADRQQWTADGRTDPYASRTRRSTDRAEAGTAGRGQGDPCYGRRTGRTPPRRYRSRYGTQWTVRRCSATSSRVLRCFRGETRRTKNRCRGLSGSRGQRAGRWCNGVASPERLVLRAWRTAPACAIGRNASR